MPAIAPPPSATPTPAPQVTAPSKPEPVSNEQAFAEINADIDSMDDAKPSPEPRVAPEKPSPKPNVPQDEPEIDEGDEPAKPQPEKPQPKKEELEVLPRKTRDLKAVYLELKEKHAETEKRVAEYEAKFKQIEETKPEQAAAVMQKLEAAEKRRQELEDEIRYVNYTKSQEFRDKYQKPYEEAWTKAVAELSEITVEMADGSTRPANANDLLQLANMPLGEARKVAKERFGDSADDVMAHRRKIRELSDAQSKALEEGQKLAGEREKMLEMERQNSLASQHKAWENANGFLKEKFPKAFVADEADPEDKVAHTRGFALADLLYQPDKLTPDQVEALPQMFRDAVKAKRPLNQSETIKLHALARVKMANEPRLQSRLKKAQAKIVELEKSLKAYEKSEPGGGIGKPAGAAPLGWQDEISREIDGLDEK